MIMGDKIFVNFMKYDFIECIRRLKNEINQHYKDEIVPANVTAVNISLTTSSISSTTVVAVKANNEPEKWNKEKVKQWFEANEISKLILDHLDPCDGDIINQMFDMKLRAPEFFFQSMGKLKLELTFIDKFNFYVNILKGKIPGIDLRSIAKFSSCLDKLFAKK